MRRHDEGFVLLEILAFFVMTCVTLTSLAVIYNGIISMMLRHNIQKNGFGIAQLEMANLEQSSRDIGETKEERADFEIETKITESAEHSETNKLEVIV